MNHPLRAKEEHTQWAASTKRRAQVLLKEVPVPEPATNEFIVLHKLQVVLQEELDALRIWRTARPMNGDVLQGIEISISKIRSALGQ